MSIIQAVMPHELSADLVPWIFDIVANLLLVKVVGISALPNPQTDFEEGTLRLEVVEVYRSKQLQPRIEISVAFRRAADPLQRARLVFDEWNSLSLDVGAHLLLAAKPVAGDAYDALAAENIASATAVEAQELRDAVRLHESLPQDRSEQLFQDALIRGKTLLRRYVLEAIANRGMVPRLQASQILTNAFNLPQMTADERLELGRWARQPTLFQEERHADRANREIISLLANGLLRDSDPFNRLTWIKFLASTLLRSFDENSTEDKRVKESLVRSVDRASWETVRQTLMERSKQGPEDERQVAGELLAVWMLGR
jgi:hypothetical protein